MNRLMDENTSTPETPTANKKPTLIIIVAVVFLLLLGGGVYFLFVRGKSQTGPTSTSSKTGSQSLKDLLLAGISQKCTYKDSQENMAVEGTVYIAGGKVRGDFSSTNQGQTFSGHTIYDGKVSYVWTEGMKTGFKMAVDPETGKSEGSSSEENVDLTKKIDYSCGPWLANESQFTPPSDITFSEFTMPTIPAGTSSSGNTNQEACKLCNTLTGEAKTQCLTSLNCN